MPRLCLLLFAQTIIYVLSLNCVLQSDRDCDDINQVLHACAGRQPVIIASDCRFRKKEIIVVPSNSVLRVDSHFELGYRATWYNGWPSEFIRIDGSNITIEGNGQIDSMGWDWYSHGKRSNNYVMQSTTSSKKLTLRNFEVHDCALWCMRLSGSDIHIDGVRIRTPPHWQADQTDGIQINANGALVENVSVRNGDDSIVIEENASNVVVRNSYVSQGNGLVIGTASFFQVRNVTFQNIVAEDVVHGINIKSYAGQKGYIDSILFENVTIIQVAALTSQGETYAIGITKSNQNACSFVPPWKDSSGVSITNVTLRDVTVRAVHAGCFKCPGKCDVRMDNVRFIPDTSQRCPSAWTGEANMTCVNIAPQRCSVHCLRGGPEFIIA